MSPVPGGREWVNINLTTSRGRVTFFNKKCKGRAGRLYIHVHIDSFGPPPLVKNEWSLTWRKKKYSDWFI